MSAPVVGRADTFVVVAPWHWVANLGGIAVTGVTAVRYGSRSRRVLFGVAVGLHVAEAAYAYGAARQAGFTRSAPKWALQTLAVGFPSLLALRAARSDVAGSLSGV